MSTNTENSGDATRLRIEGELTIFRAQELKPSLLASQPRMEVDLSGVTDIDTAGVQLLMLAKKTALAEQRELRLVGHSPVVIDVFELLNVAAYFGDPLVMTGHTHGQTARQSTAGTARS